MKQIIVDFQTYSDVLCCIEQLIEKADDVLGEKFNIPIMDTPKLNFDLKGTTAGCAYTNSNVISLNRILFEENKEEFFKDTIPHEIAHLLVKHYWPIQKCRGHGKEWKYVMLTVFNLIPERLHTMDTTNSIGRNTRKFIYNCPCNKVFYQSTHSHKKIQKRRIRYTCNACSGTLKFTGDVTTKKEVLLAQRKQKNV